MVLLVALVVGSNGDVPHMQSLLDELVGVAQGWARERASHTGVPVHGSLH